MGREAHVVAQVGNEKGTVKALLETHDLILRGAVPRRFARTSITHLSVNGATLCFICAAESVSLELGEKAAKSWAKAIEAPTPTLREKLGIARSKVLLLGPRDDAGLLLALEGTITSDPELAEVIVARIDHAKDLTAAQSARPGLPIWAIYVKGKESALGATAIRSFFRNAHYRDTKICAVSDRLTALRFNPVT